MDNFQIQNSGTLEGSGKTNVWGPVRWVPEGLNSPGWLWGTVLTPPVVPGHSDSPSHLIHAAPSL